MIGIELLALANPKMGMLRRGDIDQHHKTHLK